MLRHLSSGLEQNVVVLRKPEEGVKKAQLPFQLRRLSQDALGPECDPPPVGQGRKNAHHIRVHDARKLQLSECFRIA